MRDEGSAFFLCSNNDILKVPSSVKCPDENKTGHVIE